VADAAPRLGVVPGASLVLAFDREAEVYDRDFGTNPVGRLFRFSVQQRLAALYPRGARVLDLGCGTGEDALFLAGRGVHVTGIDPSPAMVAQARAKVKGGVFECRAAEEAGECAGPFDGAYSDFGALNCADLARVGAGLVRVLSPGAPVLFSLLGTRPWPGLAVRLLTGRGSKRNAQAPRIQGVPVPVHYPTLAEARRALGPAFEWTRAWALGAVLPDPSHAAWATRHPVLFGALAAAEEQLRAWPLVRGGGDHVVLEGRRRVC
jgi:SAM-dependent methyltransferase